MNADSMHFGGPGEDRLVFRGSSVPTVAGRGRMNA
jgi:hypothetical protein